MKASFKRLWRAPIALGILTAIGLLSALLGDGVWDQISAVTLGVPVAVAGWYGFRNKSR